MFNQQIFDEVLFDIKRIMDYRHPHLKNKIRHLPFLFSHSVVVLEEIAWFLSVDLQNDLIIGLNSNTKGIKTININDLNKQGIRSVHEGLLRWRTALTSDDSAIVEEDLLDWIEEYPNSHSPFIEDDNYKPQHKLK